MKNWGRLVLGALSIALVLLSYTLVTLRPENNPVLLPPIPDIIGAFIINMTRGSLFDALAGSLYRIFIAFLSARDAPLSWAASLAGTRPLNTFSTRS